MYWLVLGVFCLTLAGGDSLFNLDELEKSQYSVTILDTPISLEQAEGEASADNMMIMMNKFGQKYQCQLPAQGNLDDEPGSGSSEPEPEVDVSTLLAPLHSSPCLIRTKDWWTYQVCFGREISQYHVENDKPVGEIMSLGVFNPDRETEDKSQTYYPEWYTNGTKCDLTGRGRETELKFVCNDKAPTEFIGDIFEPKSCEYTIVIHTDKICEVPQFKPAPESEPLDISCQPVLMKDQMDKYERYAKLKARKIELKRIRVKQEQQKFLKMLSAGSNPLKAIPGFGDDSVNKLIKELGAFMESSLESGSTEPEVKVIDMKGEKASLIPNKDHVIEKMKKETEEGWNLVHKPSSSKDVKEKMNELQRQLRLRQNYVSRNLNPQLLALYKSIEKAEADNDLFRLASLREEKEDVEMRLSSAQKDIDNIKLDIINLRKDRGNEEKEDDLDGLPEGILKKEDVSKVKKKVKDEFPSIIKDAMKDLGIKDEELDAMDETMTAMEDELNVLLKKLQGASESNAGQQDLSSLKRDGKRSVKKELRDEEEGHDMEHEEDAAVEASENEDSKEEEKTQTIKETVERLKEMESALDNVEEGLKEKKNKLLKDVEKVKSSTAKTKLGLDDLKEESKKLFGDLEAKIEKLGLDKLNLDRPIEVKVVATNVPVGDEDMEDMDQSYYEGILHNIMMGNDKGFKDIQNQYKADKNYKFSIDEAEFSRLEQDVDTLESKVGGEPDEEEEELDPDMVGGFNPAGLYDVVEDDSSDGEEIGSLSDVVDELLWVPEARRRPSSSSSAVAEDDDGDFDEAEVDDDIEDEDDDDLYEEDADAEPGARDEL